jgi:hypothetical protein
VHQRRERLVRVEKGVQRRHAVDAVVALEQLLVQLERREVVAPVEQVLPDDPVV